MTSQRPKRTCQKVVYISSDEEPVCKKLPKIKGELDDSFHLEKTERKTKKKSVKPTVNKQPKKNTKKLTPSVKTGKKRGIHEVENESDFDSKIPNKILKTEPASSSCDVNPSINITNKELVKNENLTHECIDENSFKQNDGSWVCKNCNSHNFRWRDVCFRCQSTRHFSGASWLCQNPECGANNFHWRKDCYRCRRPDGVIAQDHKPTLTNSCYNGSFQNNVSSGPLCKASGSNAQYKEDWNCSLCGCSNFSWRVQCFRCQGHKIVHTDDKPNFNLSREVTKPLSHSLESDNKLGTSKLVEKCIETVKTKNEESETSVCVPIKKEKVENAPKEKRLKAKAPNDKTIKKERTGKVNVMEEIKMTSEVVKNTKNVTNSNEVKNISNDDQFTKECKLVARKSYLPLNIVRNVINLFSSEATVPFIVRYRSHLTGGLSAETLRLLKQNHESAKKLIDKADKMKKKLDSLGYLDNALLYAIDSCVSQQELDYLNEPFKVLKTSKLAKVIDLGLSTPADNILCGRGIVHLEQFVKDLNLNEITDLIIYYVGEMMSKDSNVMDRVRELMKTERIYLNTKQKTITANKKTTEKVKKKNRPDDVYANYYSYNCPYDRVKPYQILAINRGESEQCLQVSLDVPESFHNKIKQFAYSKWYLNGTKYDLREHIFMKGLDFMYNKRLLPYIKRKIRSELTKEGEKASLEVFSSNLKYLLLTQPVRNVTVCSVDPGFKMGCKLAILSPKQEILKTEVLYLDRADHFVFKDCTFVSLIKEYRVDLLVLGNGKGCRDVELKISSLIDKGFLNRSLKYVVASENGISVYSCSPEAMEEYPNISPNIISAISLAKRIQDPLCELVKVEPKHLGVGMYQHDINEKKLDSELDDVVSECVSIVGVDVNHAPLRILKRVAGLTESKAKAIIEMREDKGTFINREELKQVKGIGPKTFQQCAGFIKIIPTTCTKSGKKSAINHFDQTIIHPEDYNSAIKIMEMNNLLPLHVGSYDCIEKLKHFMNSENLNSLAVKLSIPFETVKLILEALSTPLDYDIRSTFDKPMFRNKATSINELYVNLEVSGRVENVTHFGAFVDLGVECNGLIYSNKLNGSNLHLGQIVKVKINDIDTNKMRIGLSLVNVA